MAQARPGRSRRRLGGPGKGPSRRLRSG